jgi:hypothetical protein
VRAKRGFGGERGKGKKARIVGVARFSTHPFHAFIYKDPNLGLLAAMYYRITLYLIYNQRHWLSIALPSPTPSTSSPLFIDNIVRTLLPCLST